MDTSTFTYLPEVAAASTSQSDSQYHRPTTEYIFISQSILSHSTVVAETRTFRTLAEIHAADVNGWADTVVEEEAKDEHMQ